MFRGVGLRKSVEQPVLDLNFAAAGALDSRITFSRGTSATFVGSNGLIQTAGNNVARFDHDPATNTPKGLLVEEARTNLVTDSESNTYFNATNVTQTATAGTAPDGSNTAIAMLETSATGNHTLSKWMTISDNAALCFSFFVKANGRTDGAVEFYGAGGIFNVFDLSNGTISVGTPYSSGTDGFGGIEDYGNGWFRVHCGLTTVSGDTSGTIQIRVRDGSAGSYAGDTSKGLYIWGFQLEQGSFLTSYIKTTGASATRNADVATMGPTTGGTELVTNGTFDTDVSNWTASSSTLSHQSGKLRVTSNGGQYAQANQNFSTVIGRRYRVSADVDFGTSTNARVQINAGPEGSTFTAVQTLTGDGTASFDFTAERVTSTVILHLGQTSSNGEYQEFDNVSVRELYPFEEYNPSEGTMVCEFERVGNTAYDYVWSLEDGTGEESMVVLSLNATHVYFSHRASDVNGLSFLSYGVEAGENTLAAYAYNGNRY